MEKMIEKLGLSDKEAKIYMTALEIGESTVTELAKKAVLKRATAHLAIGSLIMLGLLSETKKGKKRVIAPVHPRRLLELAKFRANQIEDHFSELLAIYNSPKEKPKIQVFEGEEGVRLMYKELYDSLNNRNEAIWISRISSLKKIPYSISGWKDMIRRVTNPRIRELNYDEPEAHEWEREMKPLMGKNHIIKHIPRDFEFGFTDNLIFENKLVIFSLKKDVFVIVIESEEIVKTFKALFEWVWKQGR